MEQKLLTIKNIKEAYGISRTTPINWEKKGLFFPIRKERIQEETVKKGDNAVR